MITNQQLDEIEARASAVTRGKWNCIVSANMPEDEGGPEIYHGRGHITKLTDDDQTFIIAAKEDVLALVAEIRRHRAQRFPSYMTTCPHCNNWGPETGCDDCLLAQNVELKVKAIELEAIIETMQSSIDLIHTREEPND